MRLGPGEHVSGSIWAVARQTLAQCLRLKLAVAFIALLAITLGYLAFGVKGDGTLAGRIRTLLAHATSMTGLLLTVMTVFAAVAVVSTDVRDKQIFTLATKPLARWQYILGRWVGVVILDAVLLAVAAVAIYGLAQFLRSGEARLADRQVVETEVLLARRETAPDAAAYDAELRRRVEARIQKLKVARRYDDAVQAFQSKDDLDRAEAEQKLREKIESDEATKMQSAGPGGRLEWDFKGIRLAGSEVRGRGRVVEVLRSRSRVRLAADVGLLAHLLWGGPCRINGVDGQVSKLTKDAAELAIDEEEMSRPAIAYLQPGSEVEIVCPPTLQVRYKLHPARVGTATLRSLWEVQNPKTGRLFRRRPNNDPIGILSTLIVEGGAVSDSGQTRLVYRNLSPTSVMVRREDVSALYRAGAFEWNFLRAALLVFLQLIFVAALGVFAGSFVSFPVGCLVCFVVLPFGLARSFLADAVRAPARADLPGDVFVTLGRYVFAVMKRLLPDLEATSPASTLVDGRLIPWRFVGDTAFWTLAVRTVLILAVACAIFHKRELARVQV